PEQTLETVRGFDPILELAIAPGGQVIDRPDDPSQDSFDVALHIEIPVRVAEDMSQHEVEASCTYHNPYRLTGTIPNNVTARTEVDKAIPKIQIIKQAWENMDAGECEQPYVSKHQRKKNNCSTRSVGQPYTTTTPVLRVKFFHLSL
ncbi:hypothetical protein A2U01_0034226, partial [Trifolium medium]|nr:hypothetical protein [Trifolium medium]